MSKNELIPVETKEKLEQALEFFHSLKEVKFENDEQYKKGLELVKSVKKYIKEIDDDRKSLVKPFNEKVSEINGECNGVINKLKNAENVIKNGMGKYFREEEIKRIEAQRKLEAEAEKKRHQEAERARKEGEKAEAYREQGRDEMADKAEARAETAATIASTIVSPVVENSAKAKGTSFRTVYKVRVDDLTVAADFCLSNQLLVQYVQLDVKGIERLANAQKGKLEIPGIKIIEDTQVSIR